MHFQATCQIHKQVAETKKNADLNLLQREEIRRARLDKYTQR